MKKILGIDPGLHGGIAILSDHPILLPMPRNGKDINIKAIRAMLLRDPPPFDLAVIEKANAMPGQGVCSMFTFGRAYQAIITIVEMMDMPYILVTPQRWKKKILEGTKKDKDAAISFCLRLFPGVDLRETPRCRKPHSGLADALCIAEWGKRYLAGKLNWEKLSAET